MPKHPAHMKNKVTASGVCATKKSTELNFHDKYYVGNKLGRSGFGHVYIAIPTEGPGDFLEQFNNEETHRAVKIVDLRLSKGDKHHKVIQNEISIWARLKDQPHCVCMHEVFRSDGLTYMVMERCEASLLSHMDSFGDDLNERTLGEIFAQMLMGLRQLHKCGIVHRDVKPDNFFVGGNDGHTVKLGDFGLAKMRNGGKVTGECGTAPFMCPEMIGNCEYDEKADMWSFGVMAYVLLFGRFPYNPDKKSSQDMKIAILNGKRVDFGSNIELSASALSFIMALLARDAVKRPSATEALRMCYMLSVMTNSHELGATLPSLRPCLRSAVKAHAFQHVELTNDQLDEMLNRLQIESLDMPLAQTSKVHQKSSICHVRRSSAHDPDSQCRKSLAGAMDHTNSMRRSHSVGERVSSKTSLISNSSSANSTTSTRISRQSSTRSNEASSLDDDAFDNAGSWACDL